MKLLVSSILLLSLPWNSANAAISNWRNLSDAKEGRCAFAATFDGPGETTFVITQEQQHFDEDLIVVIISNDNWSIAVGDKIKGTIKIEADDYSFWNEPVALDKALALYMKTEHISAFADSYPSGVVVYKGKQIIDRLNFAGFDSAYSEFERCAEPKRSAKAEKQRLDVIGKLPKDPFANP